MNPTLRHVRPPGRTTLILLSLLFLGLSLAAWTKFQKPSRWARLAVIPENSVTVDHETTFITLTNDGLMQRGRQFAAWQINRGRGIRFPALAPNITLFGLANLYSSVATMSAGIIIPLEFDEERPLYPINCVLTKEPTDVGTFRAALEDVLNYNGVVGIQEGNLLRLVKKYWLRTNSVAKPDADVIVQQSGATNESQPVRPETNRTSVAAGSGR